MYTSISSKAGVRGVMWGVFISKGSGTILVF